MPDQTESHLRTIKVVYWQEEGAWLGYVQDHPNYWTQGDSLEDLQDHLRDLYADITSGTLPSLRKVAELVVA